MLSKAIPLETPNDIQGKIRWKAKPHRPQAVGLKIYQKNTLPQILSVKKALKDSTCPVNEHLLGAATHVLLF